MANIRTTALPAASSVQLADALVANAAGVSTRFTTVENLLKKVDGLSETITSEADDTIIVSNSVGNAFRLTWTQLRQILDAAQRFLPNVRYTYAVAVDGANGHYTYGMPPVGYGSVSYVKPSAVYPFGYSRWTGVDGGRSWCEYASFIFPTTNFALLRTWMSISGFTGSERWFCGLTSGNQSVMQNNEPSAHYAMFRLCSALGDTTIKAVTCGGTAATRTETDLLLSPDGTWRVFEIRMKPSPQRVVFYVDGAQVAEHSANLPTAALSKYYYLNRSGAGPTMDWRKSWMLAG